VKPFTTTRRRSITTLAKTTKFPSNTHHCTRRRLVDHLLASRIHIRNTFIYHIFNVSPGARNSGWVGGAWFGFGLGRGRLFIKFPEFLNVSVRGHHILHKTGHNLLVNRRLTGRGHLLRSRTLLSRLWVQLREWNIVHILDTCLHVSTQLTHRLLLRLDAILLGNLHHLILLVETALLTTNLKITSLVYGNVHCLVYVEKKSQL
jgi:hypothetical protein